MNSIYADTNSAKNCHFKMYNSLQLHGANNSDDSQIFSALISVLL